MCSCWVLRVGRVVGLRERGSCLLLPMRCLQDAALVAGLTADPWWNSYDPRLTMRFEHDVCQVAYFLWQKYAKSNIKCVQGEHQCAVSGLVTSSRGLYWPQVVLAAACTAIRIFECCG